MDYKVPSPREIKEKFQKPKGKESHLAYYTQRPLSKYITWFLLHFTLRAEIIAFMTPLVDLVTIYMILNGNFLLAAILTYVHLIIDCVDGEIARVRATVRKRTRHQSQFGGFVDSMAGLLVYPAVIFFTGYVLGGLPSGIIAIMSLFLVVASSAYSKAYFPSKKNLGKNVRESVLGKTKHPIGFNSSVQKYLITLALLFQSIVFIWIFIIGSLAMTFLRIYLYGRKST